MTHDNNHSPAFFNGQYMPLSQVHISPLDRGFLFGDGIYEVVPVYQGKALGGTQHWQRLLQGLKVSGIELAMTPDDLIQTAQPLLDSDEAAQMLYVQVTRGVEACRKHRFPVQAEPTVLMFSSSFIPPITQDYDGCSAWLQQDLRWQRCSVKSTSLMGNVLAYHQLWQNGVTQDEALLVRGDRVVEAPSSNLFAVIDGVIVTPPVDNILNGVTRALVIEQARTQGFEVQEIAPAVCDLSRASEIWVSNSYEELKPVVRLEGKLVGSGKPGPVWRKLFQCYQTLKD